MGHHEPAFVLSYAFLCSLVRMLACIPARPRRPVGAPRDLFDLGLFVDHVLADDGVKLPDLHLVRHGALVLVGGVVVARPSGRNEFDLLTHCSVS